MGTGSVVSVILKFCFLLWLSLGFASAEAAPAIPTDALTIGVLSEPKLLHPLRDVAFSKYFLFGFVDRSLVGRDESWMMSCFLCALVPSEANGNLKIVDLPDHRRGMDASFAIRPEARWADGEPVTSRDVSFTLEVARAIGVQNSDGDAYRHMIGVTVVDQRRFVLHFDKVDYSFISGSKFFLLSEHVEAPRFRAATDPETYLDRSAYARDPTAPGLWNGPYRIDAISDREIVLAQNPYWGGAAPQFKKIVLREFPDVASLTQAIVAGTVDFISGETGLQPAEALDLAAAYPDRFEFVTKPGIRYGHIDLNLANPLLADRRVRQALMLGLDRPAMVRQLFADPRPIADSFLAPVNLSVPTTDHTYPSDPARAEALLAEAGYRRGPDGILLDPAGRRFSITLVSSSAQQKYVQQGEWLKQAWGRLGIETKLDFVSPDRLFAEILPRRQFDAAFYIWVMGPESSPVNVLSSASIPNEANGFSGQNYSGLADRRMDGAIDDLVSELDPAKRLAIWGRVQDIYAEELPALPLYFQDQTYLVPRWLTGLGPVGHGTPTSFWVENWRAG